MVPQRDEGFGSGYSYLTEYAQVSQGDGGIVLRIVPRETTSSRYYRVFLVLKGEGLDALDSGSYRIQEVNLRASGKHKGAPRKAPSVAEVSSALRERDTSVMGLLQDYLDRQKGAAEG